MPSMLPTGRSSRILHVVTKLSLGVLLAALGAGLQGFLWYWVEPEHFILFFPAVILASVLGDFWAGVSSAFASALFAAYFFFPPSFSLNLDKGRDWLTISIFLLIGLWISWISQAHVRRTQQLAQSLAKEESSKQLRFAAKAANVGIWEWNIQANQIHWDDQMLKFYGLNREDFAENYDAWRSGVHPDDRSRANDAIQAALRGEKDYNLEFKVLQPNGAVRIIHASGLVVRDQCGKPIEMFGLNRDVTEEKRAIEELRTARDLAESAALAKARFLDIAAHELRTPVTAFSLLLQLTQRQLREGRQVSEEVLARLKSQVDRLSRLVVDLLEVSRLERGAIVIKKEVADLVHLISECKADFGLQYPERSIVLSATHPSIRVRVDPIRIYEVVSNLIDNAVKYTPKNTSIEVTVEDNENLVRVSVRDHGGGIPEERQKRLFGAFERGGTGEEDRYAGLGLGLFICKGIIDLHGGKIGMNSQVGDGSAFFFELPDLVKD